MLLSYALWLRGKVQMLREHFKSFDYTIHQTLLTFPSDDCNWLRTLVISRIRWESEALTASQISESSLLAFAMPLAMRSRSILLAALSDWLRWMISETCLFHVSGTDWLKLQWAQVYNSILLHFISHATVAADSLKNSQSLLRTIKLHIPKKLQIWLHRL